MNQFMMNNQQQTYRAARPDKCDQKQFEKRNGPQTQTRKRKRVTKTHKTKHTEIQKSFQFKTAKNHKGKRENQTNISQDYSGSCFGFECIKLLQIRHPGEIINRKRSKKYDAQYIEIQFVKTQLKKRKQTGETE